MKHPKVASFLALLVIGATQLVAADTAAVAISSTAAPGYVRGKDAQGKPQAETYIFMKGHFMGSGSADASERKMSFETITKYLAANLAKQSYFPTKEAAAANNIIMVHWGTTQIYEDPRGKEFQTEQMNKEISAINSSVAESGMSDASGLNQALAESQGTAQSQEAAMARAAALLGYDRVLNKEFRKVAPTAEQLTLATELNEERYFVVLMAYDYQYMRKEKKPKLLWVTRLSIRAPGNNFTEAMPTLALAGAEVYGRQLEGLVRAKVPLQTGSVKLHELQVIGTDEKSEPEAKPAK